MGCWFHGIRGIQIGKILQKKENKIVMHGYIIGLVLCLGLIGCVPIPERSVLYIENRSSGTIIFSNMQCFEACSISPGKSEALCEQTDARIRIDRTAGLGYLTTHYFLDDQHENTTLKKELRLYKYFPFGAPFYTRDCYKLVITDKDAIYNDNKLTPLTKQYIPLDGNNNMNKQLIINDTMK